MKKNKKQHTILKGEGANMHTLYGNINVADDHTHFSEVTVNEDSQLRHEEPNGKFAEHNTLKVEKGNWSMGRQVEYNPFKQTVSTIWD